MTRSDRVVRQYLRTRLLFTTKTGQTFSGLLMESDRHTFRLLETELLNPDGSTTKAAGEVLLPRSDVAYMQRT